MYGKGMWNWSLGHWSRTGLDPQTSSSTIDSPPQQNQDVTRNRVFPRANEKRLNLSHYYSAWPRQPHVVKKYSLAQLVKVRNKRPDCSTATSFGQVVRARERDGALTLVVNCVAVHWCDKTSRVDHSIGLLARLHAPREGITTSDSSSSSSGSQPASCPNPPANQAWPPVWGANLIRRPWKPPPDDRGR